MAFEFDFIVATDKPALLALSTLELLASAKAALSELGYKVHIASNHDDFQLRFSRVQYNVLVMEQLFAAATPEENLSLRNLQLMPMSLRRHAVSVLFGESFQTLSPMQAFQYSVHAVVNPADLAAFGPIIQQTIADHDLFLQPYREAQQRVAHVKD